MHTNTPSDWCGVLILKIGATTTLSRDRALISQGTYLYVRIYGLLSTTTDSTSYLDLGLQLPANVEAGQTFTCTPAKRARAVSEVDVNGDSLSKLTEGEFAIFGYAYPRTGWLVSGSKVTARVAIERISRKRMYAQIQLAGQFAPDLGPLNIDRTLVFDRDLANSK